MTSDLFFGGLIILFFFVCVYFMHKDLKSVIKDLKNREEDG